MLDEPSKPCRSCGETKPLSDFYTHPQMADGHLNHCKACKKAYQKQHYQDVGGNADYERARQQTPDRRANKIGYQATYRAKNPEKYRARTAVHNALRDGRLVRQPCAVCGSQRVQAHHKDYLKPLDVEWLCFKHHREDAHEQALRSDPSRASYSSTDNRGCESVCAA